MTPPPPPCENPNSFAFFRRVTARVQSARAVTTLAPRVKVPPIMVFAFQIPSHPLAREP